MAIPLPTGSDNLISSTNLAVPSQMMKDQVPLIAQSKDLDEAIKTFNAVIQKIAGKMESAPDNKSDKSQDLEEVKLATANIKSLFGEKINTKDSAASKELISGFQSLKSGLDFESLKSIAMSANDLQSVSIGEDKKMADSLNSTMQDVLYTLQDISAFTDPERPKSKREMASMEKPQALDIDKLMLAFSKQAPAQAGADSIDGANSIVDSLLGLGPTLLKLGPAALGMVTSLGSAAAGAASTIASGVGSAATAIAGSATAVAAGAALATAAVGAAVGYGINKLGNYLKPGDEAGPTAENPSGERQGKASFNDDLTKYSGLGAASNFLGFKVASNEDVKKQYDESQQIQHDAWNKRLITICKMDPNSAEYKKIAAIENIDEKKKAVRAAEEAYRKKMEAEKAAPAPKPITEELPKPPNVIPPASAAATDASSKSTSAPSMSQPPVVKPVEKQETREELLLQMQYAERNAWSLATDKDPIVTMEQIKKENAIKASQIESAKIEQANALAIAEQTQQAEKFQADKIKTELSLAQSEQAAASAPMEQEQLAEEYSVKVAKEEDLSEKIRALAPKDTLTPTQIEDKAKADVAKINRPNLKAPVGPNWFERQLKKTAGIAGTGLSAVGAIAGIAGDNIDTNLASRTGYNISGIGESVGRALSMGAEDLAAYSTRDMPIEVAPEDLGLTIEDRKIPDYFAPTTPQKFTKAEIAKARQISRDRLAENTKQTEDLAAASEPVREFAIGTPVYKRQIQSDAEYVEPSQEYFEETPDVAISAVGSDRLLREETKMMDEEFSSDKPQPLDNSDVIGVLNNMNVTLNKINNGINTLTSINKNMKPAKLTTTVDAPKMAGDLISKVGSAAIDKALSIF